MAHIIRHSVQVTAYPVTSSFFGPWGGFATSVSIGTRTTASQLTNGVTYKFVVTAVALKFSSDAKSASVTATPRLYPPKPVIKPCSTMIPPSGPSNLRVVRREATSVRICFDPPNNFGCTDYYTLNVQVQGQVYTANFFPSIRLQTSQCYTVKSLTPNTNYKATVTVRYGIPYIIFSYLLAVVVCNSKFAWNNGCSVDF